MKQKMSLHTYLEIASIRQTYRPSLAPIGVFEAPGQALIVP